MVTFWSSVYYHNECRSIKKKMWNGNHHYSLLQQGAGNYDDSEESDFSQESEVLKLAKEQSFPKKST